MQKTVTLYPAYITDGASFSGILSANGSGEDYRTINAGSFVDVGTIAFQRSPLHGKSAACVLNRFAVSYQQRVNFDTIGGELRWELTPKILMQYSTSGNAISVQNATAFGNTLKSYTNGNDYLEKGGTLYSGTMENSGLFGKSGLPALSLIGGNAANFKYQLYMKNLCATITYTPRFYASFYDPDTKDLIERQTVEGGQAPMPPSVSKEGYRLIGWKSRDILYETLPTGMDEDVSYYPVFEPVYYRIKTPKAEDAACVVQIFDDETESYVTVDQKQLDNTNQYCDVRHGTAVRIYACGFNNASEDLRVAINGLTTVIDGKDSGNLLIFSAVSLQNDLTIQVEAFPVMFTVETVTGTGGNVSAPMQILRHEDAQLLIWPDNGYEIASVMLDDKSVAVDDPGEFLLQLHDVTASHRVYAAFSKIQIPITIIYSEHITVEGPHNVEHGSDAAWLIHSSGGRSISTVSVNGETIVDTFAAMDAYSIGLFSIESPVTIEITDSGDLVTVDFSACENGRIKGDKGTFIKGKGSLFFEALPDDGYGFDAWIGASWPTKKYTLETALAENNYLLGAQFSALSYHISINTHGNGQALVSAEYANYGETVIFEAIPDEGWRFTEWFLTEERPGIAIPYFSDKQIYTHQVEGKINAHANFEQEDYTLLTPVYSPDGDAVGGTVARSLTQETYHFDDEIVLEATPTDGYRFIKWSDGVFSSRRTYLMPSNNVVLTAEFCRYEYTIEADLPENASVLLTTEDVSARGSLKVKHGDSLTIQINCYYGYNVSDVIVNGNSVRERITRTLRGAYYVIPSITQPYTIRVTLGIKTYTNGRKLIDYWPAVISSILDMQEIARVQQPLIDEAWDAASALLENQFIDTATEEGVRQWEEELGLIPASDDTLTQRKQRLKRKWVPDNRFTVHWLHDWLKQVCETDEIKKPIVEGYSLFVTVPSKANHVEIFSDLERYKPANIALRAEIDLQEDQHKLKAGIGMRSIIRIQLESGDVT